MYANYLWYIVYLIQIVQFMQNKTAHTLEEKEKRITASHILQYTQTDSTEMQ